MMLERMVEGEVRMCLRLDEEYCSKETANLIATTVKWENLRPYHISGQRSAIFRPKKGLNLKAKGLVYRELSDEFLSRCLVIYSTEQDGPIMEFQKPMMDHYQGLGVPEEIPTVEEDGFVRNRQPMFPQPYGAMALEHAKSEYEFTKEALSRGLPVDKPLGYGEFLDLHMDGVPTGFFIANIRDPLDLRLTEALMVNVIRFLAKIPNKEQANTSIRSLFESTFYENGKLLRRFHDAGYILGYPHSENFKMPGLRLNRDYGCLARVSTCDLGHMKRRKDLNEVVFFGNVLRDLSYAEHLPYWFNVDEKEFIEANEGEEKEHQHPAYLNFLVSQQLYLRREFIDKLKIETYNPFYQGYFHDLKSPEIPEPCLFDKLVDTKMRLYDHLGEGAELIKKVHKINLRTDKFSKA